MNTNVELNIVGRCCDPYAYWHWINDVLDTIEAYGSIFTFELPGSNWDTNGFEIGGARVLLFVLSGVPNPMDILDPMFGLDDPDAYGLVVVYGCGYFYIGRIDYINWNIIYDVTCLCSCDIIFLFLCVKAIRLCFI